LFSNDRLKITNLDESISEKELVEVFSEFGEITSAQIECEENGKSKGCALIRYDSKEDAQDTIDNRNGIIMKGREM